MSLEFVAKNGLLSKGNTQVTGTLTVSQGITSSLGAFTTSSWATNALTAVTASSVTTASYANTYTKEVNTGSLYPITASVAITASYATGSPVIKAGIQTGSLFGGSPQTSSIVFSKPFPNNSYAVTVTGDNAKTWTIQSRVSGSFIINSNSSTTISGSVYWHAITTGEFYS